MFCKAHGGGKRCTFLGCTKGAEGSTPFCKGHGGGKRCSFQGGGVCPKSVHGGTLFCVAHGGGKRCVVTDCTKSTRGRTDFCMRHGGGKRCIFEGCGKSAMRSTDFCKAHVAVRDVCEAIRVLNLGIVTFLVTHFPGGKLDSIYHMVLLCTINVFMGELQWELVQDSGPEEIEKINDAIFSEAMIIDSCSGWEPSDFQPGDLPVTNNNSIACIIYEGRVHGGSLMLILSGNHSLTIRDGIVGLQPEPQNSFRMLQNWI